ncbi:uncharacterized protein LOC119791697 [Cyprinodon tularosa]|uniref:uncharacterized protein LOC119791697 n=1 Tax=Cyprinodon tularosa TaxID=77115 RepID=UPI0018E203BF|nr:uncharacterized protein LOC119791697 [Cyprinodon tularosa]
MNETGLRRTLPDQSSGSGHTFETSHHTSVTSTILSKRVCFYKSGDPQFNGLRVVINNRTFKTFDALLDSLSKKVPLPFGVRNITTPRGIHGIKALDDFEDGKSYICSDSRKVKPIDLALARKRLPPWYHARPVSPNRKTARFFPGRKNLHREEQGIVHTPKKLVVFRNGDPSVRHAVLLQRKTTPSYESILRHISELMQFHVNKLHTLDGRRIDGLPGLILCSGSVVAVGREPFRHVVYSMEKYPSPTRQHTKRRVSKKQKTSVSKKMTPSFSSKSRNFSASSERYIVQQIHASMGESSCDLPSNAANSIESDSDRILESLAETDEDICLGNGGNEGQDGDLPNDDNIEKSFRVNEDGSMTVEMKVRLTIKEEESVQWTTTLTRSVVADQLNMSSLPHSDPEQEVCSRNSQTSAASNDIIHKDRTSDDNDDDPPSLGNRASSDNFQDEDDLKNHTEVLLPRREPTPGCKRIRESQASVDSIKSVDEDDFGEGKVGSCFLEEQTENVTTKEQFYMENQTSTKPVPKPRRLGSVDVINRDSSALKSTEIMQTESSGDEVTETVLHIYEQHTYQDNFLANVGVHSMSASGVTSQNRQNCSSNEFEAELWPSPAFEPDSGWRADSMSVTPGLQLASLNIGAIQGPKREQLPKSKKSQVKPGDNESKKDLRVSSKPKLTRKNVQRDMTPGKGQRKSSGKATEKRKKLKPFSSAVFIKRIYGNKTKPPKKIKRKVKQTWKSLPKRFANNVNGQLSLKEETSKQILTETSSPQIVQIWQSKNESLHVIKDRPLLPINNPPNFDKEYVEHGPEKGHSNPISNQKKESKRMDRFIPAQVGRTLEETSKNSKSSELSTLENVISPSVKLRVQSFENKSMPAVTSQNGQDATQAKPPLNVIYSKMIPPTTESTEEGNITMSIDLPPPPPKLLDTEDFTNESKCLSGSLISSQGLDNCPQSRTPTSDKALSYNYNTTEKIKSALTKNAPAKKGVEIARAPSIKETHLVSNHSPETKMSPKMEPLNEPALDNYATEEETVLSVPTISNGRKEICSTVTAKKVTATSEEIPQPTLERGIPSFCTSVSPLSLTSDERMSSSSIISSETSVLGSIEFEETKISDMPKIEEKSPKSLAKKAKLKSSPSPERKMQSKNSSELQNTSTKNSAETRHIVDKDNLSQKGLQKPEKPKVSPSAETKHHELQRPSPYSQSLDVVSPPSRHKSSKKLLPRNVSLDSPLQSKNGKLKKSSQREGHQPALLKADISGDTEAVAGDQVISVMPEPIHSVDQPNMKPVLEKICYSIKSIRQITQSKRPSCLEKSNSLPDFSSHVASTFGSSSKVLLAFLAVMTLKDGLANLNMKELNAYNVSCAEALKMIDSLREIANIEDSQRLRISLSNLQKSASMQLLQSWKGFQDKSTNLISSEAAPEFDCGIGENVIDQIIDNLDIPKRLKDELVSLSDGESDRRGKRHSSRLKLLADQLIHENTGEDTVTHDEKDNSGVRSIVKQIPDIKKPAQPELDSTPLFSEAGKYKTTRQVIEDKGCKNWLNSVADSEYNPEEKKTFNIMSLDLQTCTDEAQDNPEKQKQHQRACLFEKLPQKGAESVDLYSRIEPAKQETYMDANQLTQNEKNTLYTEIIKEARSDLAEGHQVIRSANKDCFKQYTEERAEVTDHGTKQGISASSNYYAEVKVKGKKTTFNSDCKNLYDPIEIKSKVSQSQRASMGLNISTNGSTGSLNVEDPSSLEEQQEVNYKKLHVIIEESLSGNEKEEPLDYLPKFAEETKAGRDLEALIEESENDQFSSEDEIQYAADELKQQGSPNRGSVGALENPDLCSLITNKSLGYGFRSNVDDDSGNDHSSFEEHMYEVQLKDEDKQKSNLTEEELSYYENDFSSEEEETSRERRLKQRTAELQETPLRVQLEELNTKGIVESLKHQSDEVLSKSVAERVTLLEKQVAEAQKPKPAAKSSTIRLSSQRKSPPESEDSPSESPASEMLICTRSAPQSSLSFSYDSSGVITTEPEGSRVRSIREMFLARSATDIQQRGFLGPSSSELRAETSGSGGYQSQTSTDLSGNEDDSPRKSISKGFVRRAIEMLYGKKDPEPEEVSERSPSEPDQRKREPSSILSPFHAARSKAMSEFSYFNSSNALDIFSEATRCITFNAQVGPGDSVPIDNGRWLLRENTQMRKSVSDPVGINKTLTNTFYDDGFCKDKEEKTPYLLFSSKPELQNETKSQPGKCTYFSLPHASESEACQDEMSVISKDSKNEDSVEETKDASEDSKTWTERNGALPGIGVIDFKMKDNKVHPLVELPPDGEVVVVQPGKGQGVINRRIQEPDVLDLLYHFCGEHCPIL